jgi:nicotinamide-nucleotide amidase
MRAEIIAVGSELLGTERVDTNSLFLTEELFRLGIAVGRKSVVGDSEQDIAAAVAEALNRADLVLVSGGLGPTADDLTREGVARALGRRLVRDDRILEALNRRFRERGLRMPEINVRQALALEGAEILNNSRGSAPGQWLREDQRILILLPGVPIELRAIFEEECRPRLAPLAPGGAILTRVLKITGLFESQVDELAAPIYRKFENPSTTILASPGEIQLHLTASGADAAQARAALNELTRRLELALGDAIFSEDGQTMEEVAGMYLTMRGKTLAVAESCTGGLLAERLTRVPGSSRYFLGGIVAYGNEAKKRWLEVPAAVLKNQGAVSAETARILAESVRRRFGADFGLGITGVAGPSGGTPEKPVGLVYIALAEEGRNAEIAERRYPGRREQIRLHASQTAMDMLRRRLKG